MDVEVFDLVPVRPGARLDLTDWLKIRFVLGEFQPAERIEVVGDPPEAIRVWGAGPPDVAPAVLARVQELVGTELRIR
jgi:hypothetical protein